jgi:hypothetical protein
LLSFAAGRKRRFNEGLGQKRSLHKGKRNHKTCPLNEVRRFIFYLECFFLMKTYYTTPSRRGQGKTA